MKISQVKMHTWPTQTLSPTGNLLRYSDEHKVQTQTVFCLLGCQPVINIHNEALFPNASQTKCKNNEITELEAKDVFGGKEE
jgi:hypothetical protein